MNTGNCKPPRGCDSTDCQCTPVQLHPHLAARQPKPSKVRCRPQYPSPSLPGHRHSSQKPPHYSASHPAHAIQGHLPACPDTLPLAPLLCVHCLDRHPNKIAHLLQFLVMGSVPSWESGIHPLPQNFPEIHALIHPPTAKPPGRCKGAKMSVGLPQLNLALKRLNINLIILKTTAICHFIVWFLHDPCHFSRGSSRKHSALIIHRYGFIIAHAERSFLLAAPSDALNNGGPFSPSAALPFHEFTSPTKRCHIVRRRHAASR